MEADYMPKLRYSKESKEDLKSIARMIAKDRPKAARQWGSGCMSGIAVAFASLKTSIGDFGVDVLN